MAGISIQTGLATGLDTGAIIDAMLQAERQPINALSNKKAKLEYKIGLYDTFQEKLKNLRTAIIGIDGLNESLTGVNNSELTFFNAKSSNEEIIEVSSSNKSQAGDYNIEVTQLAKSEKIVHGGFSEKTESLSEDDSQFVLKIGEELKTIEIKGGETTLENLRDEINKLGDVNATILNDGKEENQYRLLISGKNTGSSNTISIDSSTTLAGFEEASFSYLQNAQDAKIKVNGLEVQRENNEINDLIEGVTLNLKKETEAEKPVELIISNDNSKLKAKWEGFVEKFNDVMSFINGNLGNSEYKSTGVLSGDQTTISVQSQLYKSLSSLNSVDGENFSLSNIGIKINDSGKIDFDKQEFLDEIEENPDVMEKFIAGENGITGKLSKFLDDFLNDDKCPLKFKQDSAKTMIDTYDKQIENKELRLVKYESNVRRQFVNLETLVSGIQANQSYLIQNIATDKK